MKLNLGCGTDIKQGFVNLDYVPGPGVDVVHDLTVLPLPFEDESVDMVYASHVFEHIENWLEVVLDIHRILKPGGLLSVRVPYGVGPQNPDAQHVKWFWPGTMDIFINRESPALDAHRYNGRFEKVEQKVMRHMYYHWHIGHYFGIWFFERFKYRFPPIGEKKEIVWNLRKRVGVV